MAGARQTKARPAKGSLPRTLGRVTVGALLLACFLVSLVFSLVGHLNLPVARRVAAEITSEALSGLLRGRIEIGGFDRLKRRGITARDIQVFDPSGRLVVKVGRLSSDVDLIRILDRVLGDAEKLSLEIARVSVSDSEIQFFRTEDTDAAGVRLNHPSIQDAFEPVPTPDDPNEKEGRPVRIWFPHVALDDVYARGSIGGFPLIDAHIDHTRAQILASDKGASIDIAQFKLSASGLLGVDTDAIGEMHLRLPGPIWGKVRGKVGEMATDQEFRFDRDHLEIKGRFPEVRPEAVRPLLPEWPLDQTVQLRNHISGRLGKLNVKVNVLAPGEETPVLAAAGTLKVDPPLTLDLKVTSHELDLSMLRSDLPETRLDSESQVVVEIQETGPVVSVSTKLQPGRVGLTPTPEAEAEVSFKGGQLTADLRAQETGLAAHATLVREETGALKVHARVGSDSLSDSPRLKALGLNAKGGLSLEGDGSLVGEDFRINGHLQGSNLAVEGLAVGQFSGDYSANGSTESPESAQGTLLFKAAHITVGSVRLSDLTLKGSGALLAPHVEAKAQTKGGYTVAASADVREEGQVFSQVKATVSGNDPPLEASVDRISLKQGRVKIENLNLKSIGKVHAEADFGPDGGTVKAEAEGLKLSRLSQVLGLAPGDLAGDVDGTVDLTLGAHSEGTIALSVTNGAVMGVTGVTLRANAEIHGRETKGSFEGSVESLGALESTWNATLAGTPLHTSSYRNATGAVHLGLRELDINTIAGLLGQTGKDTRFSGGLTVEMDATRAVSHAPPELEFSARTKKLTVSYPEGDELTVISGIDVEWAGALKNGDSIESALRLTDRHGNLASVSGAVTLPVYAYLREEMDGAEFLEAARNAPLNVALVLPKRPIQKWPSFVPRLMEQGSVGARLAVTGRLQEPDLSFAVTGKNLEGKESQLEKAVDFTASGRYLGGTGALRASVTLEQAAQRIGSLDLDVILPVEHVFGGAPQGTPLFTGQAQLLLDNAPLDLVTPLKERRLSGTAQGALTLTRTNTSAELAAELNLRRLSAGGLRLGDALLEAQTLSNNLILRAEFNDEYGSLSASAEVGVKQTPLYLEPDLDKPVFLTLASERYDAAVLLPFTSEVLDELSGPLTGRLRGEWTPATAKNPAKTTFSGRMSMVDGTVTPTALGLRLSDVRLTIQANEEGGLNVVHVTNIAAKARSSTHNVEGNAMLRFDGFDLKDGRFDLFPTKIPVLKDSATLVTVSGEMKGRFVISEEDMRVTVDIKSMNAVLPEKEDSDLIELSENSTVTVLQNYKEEKKVAAEPGVPLYVKVNLSDEVRIKSSILDLRVRGDPEVRVAEEVTMRGHIQLIPGGRVIVMGRAFAVERGTVMFDTGAVDDPHLDVVASWKAPNNVLVRATVGGTAKRPTLSWSSDPPLPGGEPEVLSLVIGSSNSEGSGAGAMAGAWMANEALGKSGLQAVEVYTNQDASSGEGRMASLNDKAWDSYTAAIRLSDELWFEASYLTPSQAGPNIEKDDGVSGTIDWRFHPNWSARTELGTLGGGIDLQWQYRY